MLGRSPVHQKRFDEAEAAFTPMDNIYRKVYGGNHYLLATATSNLSGSRLT